MDRKQPVTPVEHEAWFASLARRADCAYFAIETVDGGMHIGNVWLWEIDRRHRKAELRVVVGDTGARGQGLGAEAIDLLCRYGFDQVGPAPHLRLRAGHQSRGRRAFERAGFTSKGRCATTDGRWIASSTATCWRGSNA